MTLFRHFHVYLAVILFFHVSISAQWSPDPAVNNPICTAANTQNDAKIVTDGSGGAIITWYDYRAGSNIYARRITSAGTAQWTDNGEPVCIAAYEQYNPAIISDGAGGAYIAWEDRRDNTFYDIYVQRIDAGGSPHTGWPVGGICICSAAYDQLEPAIISDGSGGAIIAWADNRSYSYKDIYAQKISSSGIAQWTSGGIPVCAAANEQVSPVLAADEAGGAFIAWRDRRADSFKYRVFVQRIDASGNVPAGWVADGKAVSTGTYIQDHPVIMADGAGGAIVAWEDYRTGTGDYSKVYAHRIDADGSFHTGWTAGGVVLSNVLSMESTGNWISITSDQNNGAIVAWVDYRNSSDDIYAQRITSGGAIAAGWPADGTAVCSASDIQILPEIAGDGSGGAIITWQDQRLGTTDANIYAQRVNPSGAVQWAANGVPVCSSAARQEDPVIVADGTGGAIIAWTDTRNSYYDIYSAHINGNGALPVELNSFTAETVDGQVTLNWTTATEVDNYGFEIERNTRAANADWETIGFVKGHGNSNSPKKYSFTDIVNPGRYAYRLKQIDSDGKFSWSVPVEAECINKPLAFGLAQNHPNPFNPKTTIKFELPSRSMVKIEVYNSAGQMVALLTDNIKEAGSHKVEWAPDGLSSGIYYYTIFAHETEGKNTFRSAGKMLYLK